MRYLDEKNDTSSWATPAILGCINIVLIWNLQGLLECFCEPQYFGFFYFLLVSLQDCGTVACCLRVAVSVGECQPVVLKQGGASPACFLTEKGEHPHRCHNSTQLQYQFQTDAFREPHCLTLCDLMRNRDKNLKLAQTCVQI